MTSLAPILRSTLPKIKVKAFLLTAKVNKKYSTFYFALMIKRLLKIQNVSIDRCLNHLIIVHSCIYIVTVTCCAASHGLSLLQGEEKSRIGRGFCSE